MKKTILHIIPVFATGGAERLVLQYARLFDASTYDIHIASCVEDGPLREAFEQVDGVHVFVGSRSKSGGRKKVYAELEEYARRIEPDIIHTHMLSADFFGYTMKKKFGASIQWVSTMHNVETATSWLRQLLWTYILRRADRVISVSERVEAFTKRAFHIDVERSVVLRNGIVVSEWKDIQPHSYTGKNPIRIASVGRFWRQKGHTYLLQAVSRLNREYELHLFGDGPLKDRLQQEARTLGIEDHITWHGVVSDIPTQIANMDIVVQPSLWEGLSLVVMEMMAAGRPVITTPAGGDELIEHGKTGYIVSARDPQALSERLEYAFTHADELSVVAIAAKKKALNEFDISTNVSGLIGLYSELC